MLTQLTRNNPLPMALKFEQENAEFALKFRNVRFA